jgi:hypothetical protein
LLACAVIALFVACLAALEAPNSFHVRRQRNWGFSVKHFRGDGPESFHVETFVAQAGPLEFNYVHQVSAGPVVPIQTIAIAGQREIEIFVQHIGAKGKESTVFLYCVWEQQRRVQNGTYAFGIGSSATNGLRFNLISSRDGGLVGVTERMDPTVVLIVRDFSSGFDWPGRPWTTPKYWEAKERTAQSLIAQLAQDNHLPKLVLGRSMAVGSSR